MAAKGDASVLYPVSAKQPGSTGSVGRDHIMKQLLQHLRTGELEPAEVPVRPQTADRRPPYSALRALGDKS